MTATKNLKIAQDIVDSLIKAGLRKVVICAGSFNSALIAAFNIYPEIEKIFHFEERSAAFFAMGWSKNCSEAVAVCLTSGTAVAECLPAVIEAYYNSTKLIIISADREESLSGSGYPQAILQKNILSEYCLETYDIKDFSEIQKIEQIPEGPLHINVRFSEPILEKDFLNYKVSKTSIAGNAVIAKTKTGKSATEQINLSDILKDFSNPLFILDKIPAEKTEQIEQFLMLSGAPILAEARSGLRESAKLSNLIIKGTEKTLTNFNFDVIIRIGSIPSFNLWRSLQRNSDLKSVPVVSVSQNQLLTGLSRDSLSFNILDCNFDTALKKPDPNWIHEIFTKDKSAADFIDQLISKYPQSEAAFIRAYSLNITGNSLVYLGNSLPIREWNEFACFSRSQYLCDANRGANGIDGQIASFFGAVQAQKAQHFYALLGDLTFLYDCNSLSLSSRLSARNYCIAVINNSGGQIFNRLDYFEKLNPTQKQKNNFVNQHDFSVAKIAQGFGINAITLTEAKFPDSHKDINLIELIPNQEQTDKFNAELNQFFHTFA